MTRVLGAVAAGVVGRIVRLTAAHGHKRGTVVRVTGRGMTVRCSDGRDRHGLTHHDIETWED